MPSTSAAQQSEPAGDARQLVDAPPLQAADRLSPTSRGTYAVYQPADGSAHLVFRPEGATEDQHMHFPAAIVRMAQAAAEGKSVLPGPLGKLMQSRVMKGQAKQNS